MTATLTDRLPVAECKRRDALIARCMGWTRVRDGGHATLGCPPDAPRITKPVPRPASDNGAALRAFRWLARHPAIAGCVIQFDDREVVAAVEIRRGGRVEAADRDLAPAVTQCFLTLLADGTLSEPT